MPTSCTPTRAKTFFQINLMIMVLKNVAVCLSLLSMCTHIYGVKSGALANFDFSWGM